jgi:excisionase family DNA binding protein
MTAMKNLIALDRDDLLDALREALQEAAGTARSAPEPWMGSEQAAAYLDTTPAALRDLIRRSDLPHHRAPGSSRLLFRASEIDTWIARGA